MTRSRTAELLLVLLLAFAPPAQAEIRVVDTTTGATTVPVASHTTRLVGWNDDGSALLIDRIGLRWLPGGEVPEPLRYVTSIGPGGRAILEGKAIELHAPDGHVIARVAKTRRDYGFTYAWSQDGARVAIAGSRQLVVLDTATGATLLRREDDLELTRQAFAPDGSALVASTFSEVLRLDIATGAAQTLYSKDSYRRPAATWSSTGRIAIAGYGEIRIPGFPTLKAQNLGPPLWSGDGTTIAYRAAVNEECEEYGDQGVAVFAPGGTPRLLVEPGARDLYAIEWAPTGARLAIDLDRPPRPAKRGKRHPWPKTIAHDYSVGSRAGNAAVRRMVVRATRMLKRGATLEAMLLQMHRDYERIAERFDSAGDSEVEEAVASELDPWLKAAGYDEIGGLSDLSC